MTITITEAQAAHNLAVVLKSILASGFQVQDEHGFEHLAISRAQQRRAHEALAAYSLAIKGSL